MWGNHIEAPPAEWQVGMLLYAPHAYDKAGLYPSESRTGIVLCTDCKEAIGDNASAIFTEDSYRSISNAFAAVGKIRPDPSRTHLKFYHIPEDYLDMAAYVRRSE
jgi:hypothetical protein